VAPGAAESTTTTVAAPVDGVVEAVTEQVPVVAPVLVELPVHGRGPARVVAGVPARLNALVREAIAVHDEMVGRLNDAQTRNRATAVAVTRARERVDRLSFRERAALAKLDAARQMFEDRVRWAYTRGPTASLEGFLQSRTAAQLTGRKAMVQFVLEQDTAAVSRYLGLRNDVGAAVTNASDSLEIAERAHARTQLADNQARADADLTTLTVAIWNRARRAPRDLVFPVVGVNAFGSDFGNPRMVGSPDEHQHQGNDIVAPLGAQLVAVEPGMVVAMGTDRLGGTKLWLAGRSGTYYYYAHLSKFADDVHEGDIVPAGRLLGFVGNTGNARGGIPHLHFEIHPAAGPAVDPYPYLAPAARRQRTEKWP
jgi:murein DD-endopeptidase MepM/ murein hydrolase activator NlpD